MVQSLFFVVLFNFLLFVFAPFAFGADTLFEGYYKITSGDQHIGFSIVRYQYDAKEKKFSTQQMTRISAGKTDVLESLIATTKDNDNFDPISYKYTSLVGKQTKTIDAKFNNGKMSATVKESGKKAVSIKNDLKPKTFLSSFLVYRMLRSQNSPGFQTNLSYDYTAIAEEYASIETGTAKVIKEEKYKGFSAFKVENNFKGKFISYVNEKGEALVTEVKDAHISTELVPKAADAIGTIGLPEVVAKNIFGNIPVGDKNVVTQYFNALDQPAPTPGKQEGVEPGKGIMIKGQTPPSGKSPQEGP
jgi:hypothetical protein